MLTADYSDLLRGVTEIVLGSYPPKTAEATLFRGYLSRRLRNAWETEQWPDLVRIEQRTYRAAWASATVYTAGTEVYDALSNAYFQALTASTGQAPTSTSGSGSYTENSAFWAQSRQSYSATAYSASTAYLVGDKAYYPLTRRVYQCYLASTANLPTDATHWGILTDFDQYIAFAQTGETAIGHAFAVTSANPYTDHRYRESPFRLSHRGIQVPTGPAVVWVRFRLRCPQLTGSDWNSDTPYATGAQVSYTVNGALNFYTALATTAIGDSPASAPSSWAVVEIPLIFRDHLIYGAAAEYYALQGQADKALAMAGVADQALGAETDILYRQQDQTQVLRVNTYPVPSP
jgi:hypothetical protein